MCGIAGFFQQADGAKLVDVMSDRIAHRGPDSRGPWASTGRGPAGQLGFRRLSIIDLSALADQPLRRDGMTLIYNGELYNYKDLRTELAAGGVRFSTSSDTEVVLEAWRRWGPDALQRFRGMFAFALFDEATGELILARDPLGIKPLYYLPRGSGVVFASELKALVSAVGSELRMEPGALVASMLSITGFPEQRCAIDGVRKLPPGSWARFRPGGGSSLPGLLAGRGRGRRGCRGAARGPGRRDRGISPRSPGLRRPGVEFPVRGTGFQHHHGPGAPGQSEAIDAYTIAFRAQDQRLEAMPDDAAYARKVAARYGISLHEIEISPDITRMLPRIVNVLDEPIGDPAAINTLLMCDAARERGVKVVLSGMGADELLGGYRKHLACVLASKYSRVPGPVRAAVSTATGGLPVVTAGRGLRYARWAKRFLTFADLPEEPRFRRSYTLYDADELTALLSPDLAGHVDAVLAEHAEIYSDNALGDEVNRMCLADSRLFLPGLNLAYTDRATPGRLGRGPRPVR